MEICKIKSPIHGALATSVKIIQDMVSKKTVISLLDKSNSQIHNLYINDTNQFNKLENELSKIETIIDSMSDPILKIFQSRYKAETEEERNDYIDLQTKFQRPYKNVVDVMLQDLLLLTHSGDFAEDPGILYTRIIKCFLKLTRQSHFLKNSTGLNET